MSKYVLMIWTKNLGLVSTDKSNIIKKCHRELCDIVTYTKVADEEAKILMRQ